MRRSHAGLAGRVSLALAAALVLTLVFVAAVYAVPDQPDQPQVHCFYGTVKTNNGVTLPGKMVTARAWTGSWAGSVSQNADSESRYGYEESFCVPQDLGGNSGADPGDEISFYVLGVRALLKENGVGAGTLTYVFNPAGAPFGTNLDLVVYKSYTIAASAGEHGSISPAGNVSVDYGQDKTFTFTPDYNYLILDVLVDGVSNPAAVAAGKYTFNDVVADHTIHVTFVRANYYFTVTAGPGCTILPAGTGTPPVVTVPYKGSQVFTIAPNTGYDLVDVIVDGASRGPVPSVSFTNVVADHTIAATCKLKTFVITASAGPNGSIAPSGSVVVNYDSDQTFTFTPSPDYQILDVLVDGVSNPAAVAAGSYTFENVKENGHTIHVTFVRSNYTITVSAGVGCTITPPGPTVTVPYMTDSSFTIAANAGYDLVNVMVDGQSKGAVLSYVFEDVVDDHTISATCQKRLLRVFLPLIVK